LLDGGETSLVTGYVALKLDIACLTTALCRCRERFDKIYPAIIYPLGEFRSNSLLGKGY
jgi:hypothetical protein